MTWTNLLYNEADQRVLPQAFDILGIGINKHKTNMTGKIEWTGITRHVRADCDPFFALANLMAHEIEVQNFRFIDMLQSTDVHEQQLWKCKVFFPNTDKDEAGQKRQISSLLDEVTQHIPGWDKDKRTGLFRKTAAGIASGAGADSDQVNRQMGWKGDTQSRSCAVAYLEAYADVQAMQAGFDKDSWRLQDHLGRAAVAVDESWHDVLIPGLTTISELSVSRQEVHALSTSTESSGFIEQLQVRSLTSEPQHQTVLAGSTAAENRKVPEAIEQLVVQGLTSDAADALVTHVVTDFGLQSISTQSEAFYELARFQEAGEAEDSAEVAAIGAKKRAVSAISFWRSDLRKCVDLEAGRARC